MTIPHATHAIPMAHPCRLALPALLLAALAAPADAQDGAAAPPPDTLEFRIDPLVVTATRTARPVSEVPRPVNVLQRRDLVRTVAGSVVDLFRPVPGLDVTGVGPAQMRPQIRGQRGQRILLLADGLRLNNFRRQQDFGELPALVDPTGIERVEVVRGPGSVLYGSDAIGGVVNLVTRVPDRDGVHGTASYRYGHVEDQSAGSARVFGRFGGVTLRAGGTIRETGAYLAPAGTFGGITLADETLVLDSGVDDRSFDARLGWEPADGPAVWGRVETYRSDDGGFGRVDPALYAPGSPDIRITYPFQRWTRLTGGFRAERMDVPVADRVEVLAYGQDNERALNLGFAMALGPTARLSQTNQNETDIRTYGARVEARKLAGEGVLLTYGVDLLRERAQGTDESRVVVTGFGPPMEETSDRPQLPEARIGSVGVFAQAEVEPLADLTVVGGARWTRVTAETFATPGLPDQEPTRLTDGTVVAAVNTLYDVGGGVGLVASVGRAFRSPNLIERFFDGPTPEGAGYQVRNPGLEAEHSLNVDLGVRYTGGRASLEAFAFRNHLEDGIRIEGTGEEIQGLPAFRNVNVEDLVFRGLELSGSVRTTSWTTVEAGYTRFDASDSREEGTPVGDTYGSKLTAGLRLEAPDGRFWAAWQIRHQGERGDVALDGNPLGDVLPSFTVQHLRGGVRLFDGLAGTTHRLDVALTNLTDELYAEFSNAAFFRPEPKRNLTVGWTVSF